MVEAARVVIGRFDGSSGFDGGRDARLLLQDWLKKHCMDYRLRVDSGTYTVDMLFYQPKDRFWLTNTVQVYAKRWGFKRSQWDRDNMYVMTKEEYLQGPTPVVSKKATDLLGKIYKRSIERAAYPPYSTLGAGVSVKVNVVPREEWAKRPRVRF